MLNIGNRIKYNNTIYRIVGINFSTYYLCADNNTSSYDYDILVIMLPRVQMVLRKLATSILLLNGLQMLVHQLMLQKQRTSSKRIILRKKVNMVMLNVIIKVLSLVR